MPPIIRRLIPNRSSQRSRSRGNASPPLRRAADAIPLREQLKLRDLSAQHALDLLKAFRQDVTKHHYATWKNFSTTAAIRRCRSAASCSTSMARPNRPGRIPMHCVRPLQIINHLQDCAKDYRDIDRVYIPLNDLSAHGLGVEALAEPKASPALLACLHALAARTGALIPEAA